MVYLNAEDSTLSECSVFSSGGSMYPTRNVAYLQQWVIHAAMLNLAISENMPSFTEITPTGNEINNSHNSITH